MGVKWRDFQLPKKLDCDEASYSNTYGKFFAAPFERQPAAVHPEPLSLRGHRVLVVGPHTSEREILARLLTHWGCDFEEVPDWKTANLRVQRGGSRDDGDQRRAPERRLGHGPSQRDQGRLETVDAHGDGAAHRSLSGR